MLHVTIDPSMLTGKPENGTFDCEIAVNIAGCGWDKDAKPSFAALKDLRESLYPWYWTRPTKLIIVWLDSDMKEVGSREEFTLRPAVYGNHDDDFEDVKKHYNSILENQILDNDADGNPKIEDDKLKLKPEEIKVEVAEFGGKVDVVYSDSDMPPEYSNFYNVTISQFAQYLAPLNVKSGLTFFASKDDVVAPPDAKHYFLYPVCDQQDNRWGSYPNPPEGAIGGDSAEIIYKLNDEPTMILHSRIEEIPPDTSVKKGSTQLRDSKGDFRGHTGVEVSDSDELFNKQTFKEKIIRGTAGTFDLAGLFYEFLNSEMQRAKILSIPANFLADWSIRVNELFLSLFRDRYSVGNPINRKHTEAILGFDKTGVSLGAVGLIHSYTADIRNPTDYVRLVPEDVHAKIEAFDTEFLPDTWFEILNDAISPSLNAALRRAAQYIPTPDEISVAKWLELWGIIVAHDLQPENKNSTDDEKSSRREQIAIIQEKRALVKLQIVRAVRAYIKGMTEPESTATDEKKKKLELIRENSLRLIAAVADRDFQLLHSGDLLLELNAIDLASDPKQAQFDSADYAAIEKVLKTFRASHVQARSGVRFFPSIAAILTAIADLNLPDNDLGVDLWPTFTAFVGDTDVDWQRIFAVDVDKEIKKLLSSPTDVPPNVLIKVDVVDPGGVLVAGAKEDDLAYEIAGFVVMMQRGGKQFENQDFTAWKGLNWSRVDLLTKKRASTTEPYSPEKPVSLRRDYFIPSLLPEELIDEANLVGGPGDSHAASSIKNVFLPLTNERLSLPAGHDLYEETEEFDAADKELRKYLFQYLFENGSGNDRTAVPAAYALWYGYLYNFAGFVVLNSGVLPEVLRNNSDDWLIPKVEIPAGDIVDGTLYKHLRRVRFSKAYCEVSGTNGKNLIRIPTGLLTIASELKEPEIEPTMPDESENIEDRATYLLFDQAKGRNQESLQINLGKPMTTFWNWYAWRGDEFVDEGKKKLNTVLEREFEIRNQPQKKHDGEENEYLDDPALENVLRIDVEQLHPTRQDEGGFFLKLKTRPINELDVVEKGIVTIKMGGRSVNVKGSEQTILVPPGTVVKITVKCLTSIEHFQPKTRRFHGFMNSVLDSTKEYEYNGHLYHYTKPVEMIFEAAKAPNIDKDGFNPSVFWSALKPFETDQGQVALNIVKEHAEFAYFSRAAIDHQVWHWNGRLTADLLDAAGPDEFAKFPESLDPRDGGQTNYAMKWEAWEFSDRPDFSSLRSTANLTVRRADNERQTLFTDSQGVTDKALYYRFKAQLFGRYELLGGDYAVRVKSELMLTDGKTEWKRFLKPAKKTTQLPKPAIRFAIPLTLSVDECPNSNEVKSSSIMIVLNDTWFTELGLAEECEVGIEVLDSDGQKYLNAGPDPILSGKRLNRVAKLSEQDRMSGYYIEEAENEENPVAVFTPLGPAGLTFDFATPTPKLTGSTFILSVVDINRFLVKDPSVQDATQLSEWGMAQIAIRRNVDKRLWEDTRFFNAIRNFCDLKEEQKSDEIERLAKEYFKPQPPDLEEHLETLWTAFNAKTPDAVAYLKSFDDLKDLYRRPDNERRDKIEKELLSDIKSEWSAKEWVQFLPDTSSIIPVLWKRQYTKYGYISLTSVPVEKSFVIRAKGLIFPQMAEKAYEERTETYLVVSERTYNIGGQPVEKYAGTFKWDENGWFDENDPLEGNLNFTDFEGYARILTVRVRPQETVEKENMKEELNIWESLFGGSRKRVVGFKEVQDDPRAAVPLISKRFSVRIKKMTIEEMNLEPVAKKAAEALLKAHPQIVFTSGRRTKNEQARSMASNIVSSGNRKWIEQTYIESTGRSKLQHWVDSNPAASGVASLTTGLLSVLGGLTDDELSKVSKHLTGLAFDVQPVTEQAEKIKKAIQALPGLTKFLEREGGLVRWHAQF